MKPSPMAWRTFFDPQHPLRGFRISTQPGSLPDHIFSNIQNVRFSDNSVEVRWGLQKLTAAVPVAAASFRGCWCGYVGAHFLIFAAYRVGSSTRVYSLDYNAFTWTEVTADGTGSSARNGNTRFTSDQKVVFQAIRDQKQTDLVVMQNGKDHVRIVDQSLSVGETTSIHQPITPTNVSTYSVLLDFPTTVELWEDGTRNSVTYSSNTDVILTGATNATPIAITWSGGLDIPTGSQVAISGAVGNTAVDGVWTFTRTGTRTGTLNGSVGNGSYTGSAIMSQHMGFADSGAGLELTVTLSISSLTVANDWAKLALPFPQTIDLTSAPQLIIIFSTAFYGIWNQIKITALDLTQAHEVTIWDPASSIISPVYLTDVDPLDVNAVMVGFDLTALSGSVNLGATNCATLKFTWVSGVGPGTNQTCLIDMIALSGTIPGSPQYGIAWQNSESRAESYGQIVTNVTTGTLQKSNSSPNSGLKIPNSPLFFYRSQVTVQDLSASEISAGSDTLRIYRQDFGEVQFTLADSIIVNPWNISTGWPTSLAGTILTEEDATLSPDKDFSQILPDADHVPIQIGNSMTVNGTRLYVGGVGPNVNEVWVSDSTSEVKFRDIVRFLAPNIVDQTSPARDAFTGEIVTALWQSPGQYVGVAPVFVFTNSSVWRLDGLNATALNRPTRVNLHGCPWAGTIAEHYGDIYWVDPEREVRSLNAGNMLPYSKNKVDSLLINGDLTNASAAVMQDRYYLAYQPQGQTVNQKILFYEILMAEWGQDLPSVDAAGLLTIDNSTIRKIYLFNTTGLVYQTEVPGQTTDDGTAIPVVLTTPELHGGMWNTVSRKRVGVATDPASSTLTVTSTWQPATSGQDGTIDLSRATGSRSWIWENATKGGVVVGPGGNGLSVILSLSGNLPGGFNFYTMGVEFEILPDTKAISG